MEKLITIQKREKLNDVYAMDEKGPGGANHQYVVEYTLYPVGKVEETYTAETIQFQCGPRREEGSCYGVIDSDLLEIVRHRLQCFQAGAFASRENAVALTHIEEALMWMNRRVEDRIERNVLGTYNK